MASAFEGVAQTVPEGKYATSANEMPKFMQDAIYNQIQLAQNIAQTPYQEYNMPLVAEATPDQQQAWANIRSSQGSWQPGMDYAQQGMAALSQAPGQAAAAQPYFQQVAGMSGMASAQPALQQQANLLGGINYNAPAGTLDTRQNQYLSPELANYALQQSQQAYGLSGGIDIAGSATPYMQRAAGMSGLENAQGLMSQQANVLGGLNYNAPASTLDIRQNQYLNPEMVNYASQQAQQAYGLAGGIDIAGAANPYIQRAAGMSGLENAQGLMEQQAGLLGSLNYNNPASNLYAAQNAYLNPDLATAGLQAGQQQYGRAAGMDVAGAAQPYLQQAAQTSAAGIEQYMNPYQEGVMNALAKQSSRNLSENLLPAVSDAFIRAGQFGGSRMGEFGSRAVRDTQEALLNQQAQALQQGYGQALTASQADLARQAQLASTAGQLTGQQQSALTNIGQAQTAAGQAQQQAGLNAAQQISAAQQQALSQAQASAAQYGQLAGQVGSLTAQQQQMLANLGQTSGQLTGQQAAHLMSLGQAQTGISQAQQQAGLTAAQQAANAQQQALSQAQAGASQYGQLAGQVGSLTGQQQQLLASLGQNAGQLTGQQASHLLALGQAQAGFGQAQQQAGLGAAQNLSGAQQQAISQQLQGAGQYGALGGALGSLTADQQRILAGLGTSAAGFAGGDINTQMSALSNVASLAQSQQGMAARDAAALEAVGSSQQAMKQQELSAAYQQQQQQQLYQQQMADWLSTQVRGMAPITPQQTTASQVGSTVQYGASPLSQVAGAYATYKGLTGS
jgi:hypothetical protein